MQKITYSPELIKLRALFETFTKANLKDCFYDQHNMLVFVVDAGEMAKAIGRNGSNVKRLENGLKRKIKIVEFAPTADAFLRNLIMPLRANNIIHEEEQMTIVADESKTRGLLIGRAASNLRNYENTMQRYFKIREIKVR